MSCTFSRLAHFSIKCTCIYFQKAYVVYLFTHLPVLHIHRVKIQQNPVAIQLQHLDEKEKEIKNESRPRIYFLLRFGLLKINESAVHCGKVVVFGWWYIVSMYK